MNWLKRSLWQLPVVGPVISPVLSLVPSTLLGAALGSSVLYGVEEGDMMAAKTKGWPKVKKKLIRARQEARRIAGDMTRDLDFYSAEQSRFLQRQQVRRGRACIQGLRESAVE